MQVTNELVAELVAARLAAGKPCVLVVRTGSMAPLLRPGDAVRVTPLGEGEPQRGAVLVVRQGHFLVTHRLVDWAEAGGAGAHAQLLLQGDACPGPDRPVAASAVLGVVVARRRDGRWRNLHERGWRCKGVMVWGCGFLGLLLRRPPPPTHQDPKALDHRCCKTSPGNKSISTKERP